LTREYAIGDHEATLLTTSAALADYFEATVRAGVGAKLASNWLVGEVSAALHRADVEIEASPVSASQLAALLKRIEDNTISGKIAKDVFDAMWSGESAGDADAIIGARGLSQISDSDAIDKIVADVIAANPGMVAEYRAGREKAFNALVGQAMKASKGKANPAAVNAALKRKLTDGVT
jgi:aspartyl-tRNA(Asn)/glutamyl-tRNA(Gln) amidotransferase subunit B